LIIDADNHHANIKLLQRDIFGKYMKIGNKMETKNIKEMQGNKYTTKVNGIIPWSVIPHPPLWVGGDPNPGFAMIAFSSNNMDNTDAFIVVNSGKENKKNSVAVTGTTSTKFDAFQTNEDESKSYSPSGNYSLKEGKIIFDSPKGSVTTFFGN